MTRKRKTPDTDNNSSVQSKSEAAGFGQQYNDGDQAQKSRNFKSKKPRNETPRENGDDEGRFPTELIRYLKQMTKEEPEQDMIDVFMEKCLEEVKDKEELLLQFTEGCYVVEQIFLRSKTGAYEFLERLNHRKKAQRLQLVQNAASERTIEKLMYRLVPLDEEKHIELFSNWIELIIDNWQAMIFDRSGSFFIRTLGRVLIGLGEEYTKFKSTFEAIQEAGIKPKRILPSAKAELQKLLTRVFDFVSMKDFINLNSTALIIQNYAAFDKFLKTKNGSEFVKRFIKEGRVADSWRQSNSSRVWDSLIELIDDEELQLELFNAIKPEFTKLATHEYAHFPLESLFRQSRLDEIAQEVFDQLLPLFPDFLRQQNILPIVGHTLELLAKHEDLQTNTMKLLRKQFESAGAEQQQHFVPNLLTLNSANLKEGKKGLEFDVENSKLFGSLILDKLFQFTKKKALMISFTALSPKTFNQMSMHKIASHAFDGFARSSTIDLDVKKEIFGQLNCDEMIKDAYGSRVFESFWFELEWTEEERERLVNDLFLPLLSSTDRNKFISILLAKLHVNEFRENRRQWRSQLNKWIREEKSRRQIRQQHAGRTHQHGKADGSGSGVDNKGNKQGGKKPYKKKGGKNRKDGQQKSGEENEV